MNKLLAGIRDFHERVRPTYRERYAHLALGQAPDCLFVACADSRVVPNLFASTDPGDLFVLRNVGNIVPPSAADPARGATEGTARGTDENSAGAAVEFAVLGLGVGDIVVCGHSGCGAMRALLHGERPGVAPHFSRWLDHAAPSMARLARELRLDAELPLVDRLSQVHVLQQVEHLRSYAAVADRVADGRLRLHAWWFDLAHAQVLAWVAEEGRYRPLVELPSYAP